MVKMMAKKTKPETLAKQVRNNLKSFICDKPSSFDSNFFCACAVASYTLWKVLLSKGYSAKFVRGFYRGDNHCFVICNNQIIDITATQFDIREEVYITDSNDNRYDLIDEDSDALNYLNDNWPSDQIPQSYVEELGEIINAVVG